MSQLRSLTLWLLIFIASVNAIAFPFLLLRAGFQVGGLSALIAISCHVALSNSKVAADKLQSRHNISVKKIRQLCIIYMVVATLVNLLIFGLLPLLFRF